MDTHGLHGRGDCCGSEQSSVFKKVVYRAVRTSHQQYVAATRISVGSIRVFSASYIRLHRQLDLPKVFLGL